METLPNLPNPGQTMSPQAATSEPPKRVGSASGQRAENPAAQGDVGQRMDAMIEVHPVRSPKYAVARQQRPEQAIARRGATNGREPVKEHSSQHASVMGWSVKVKEARCRPRNARRVWHVSSTIPFTLMLLSEGLYDQLERVFPQFPPQLPRLEAGRSGSRWRWHTLSTFNYYK